MQRCSTVLLLAMTVGALTFPGVHAQTGTGTESGASSPAAATNGSGVPEHTRWLERARAALPRHQARDFGSPPPVPQGIH